MTHHLQHPEVGSDPGLFIPYKYHHELLRATQDKRNKYIQDSKGDEDPEAESPDKQQGQVKIKYQVS